MGENCWDVDKCYSNVTENFPGSSISFELHEQKYMFIGGGLYTFDLIENNDKIGKYTSNLGSNDVNYPSAYVEKKIYFKVYPKNFSYDMLDDEENIRKDETYDVCQ